MANLKPAGTDWFVQFVLRLFANERVKFTLSDLIEKRAYLLLITRNLKFYATVRQVADPTGNVEALGDVAHSEPEPDALDVTFVKHLKRDHGLLQDRTGHRLFIRVDETEAAFLVLNRIDRHKVLAAVLRREAGCRFVPFAEIFRGHLISGFVIKANGNFFERLRYADRKPILISGIEIHRDERMIVWLKHAARMPVSNLKPVISKCTRQLQRVFARIHFSVCICAENNGRAQRCNQNQ